MSIEKIISTYPALSSACQDVTNKGESNVVSIGARPSGSIHLGNLITIANSFIIADKIGSHLSDVDFTICDLDMPDMRDWEIGKKPYTKYFAQIPHESGDGSLLDLARRDLDFALSEFSRQSGVNYNMSLFSELQREPIFRDGLKKMIDKKKSSKFPIYPICPTCKTGRTKLIEREDMQEGSVLCENDDCRTERYDFNVCNTDVDLSVHFAVDPIRDVVLGRNVSFHVFGRDYLDEDTSLRTNGRHKTKIDRVSYFTRLVAESENLVPHYFLSPVIYASDGNKMSKSRNNGLELSHLIRRPDGLKRVFDFAVEITEKNMSHIDYSLTYNRLLK